MTPRTPKQFQEIRDEKKIHIMSVALEHFANEGYHKTTISHIAKHAGISKGLMYNYFESKEALLEEIVKRSVLEIYEYFDTDRDGYLSEEEFVYFVRKLSVVLREKRTFWRLIFQLFVQSEVREQFLKSFQGSGLFQHITDKPEGTFISDIVMIITEYFVRKKEKKGPGWNPFLELNMFIMSLVGFAFTYIFIENGDENYYEKALDRIIEFYK